MKSRQRGVSAAAVALLSLGALLGPMACQSSDEDGKVKDAVGGELTTLGMQVAVYHADAGKAYRSLCPVGQSAREGARKACTQVTHAVPLASFKENVRKAFEADGGKWLAAHDAALGSFIALLQQPQAAYEASAWGGAMRDFLPYLPAAVSQGPDAGKGNGGPMTPIPRPSGGERLAGPLTVSVPAGSPFVEARLDNVGNRGLETLRAELAPGCAFRTVGVMAGPGFGGGSRVTFRSADGVTWTAPSRAPASRLFLTFLGGAESCSLSLRDARAGKDAGQAADIPEGTSHYMTLVAFQKKAAGGAVDPEEAHVFASFAAVTKDAKGGVSTSEQTISWLPAAPGGAPVASHPVPGRNWGLAESLRMGRAPFRVMFRWGPFRISKALHDKAVARKAFMDQWAAVGAQKAAANPGYYRGSAPSPGVTLQEDGLYYMGADASLRPGLASQPPRGASNGVHAVGDVVGAGKSDDWLGGGNLRGWRAAELTLSYYLALAGNEFVAYPKTGDALGPYVTAMQGVADVVNVGSVPHAPQLPVLPADGKTKGGAGTWTGEAFPHIE